MSCLLYCYVVKEENGGCLPAALVQSTKSSEFGVHVRRLAIVVHDRPQMQDCIREKLVDMVIGGFIYRIMALMYLARCSESLSVHVDAHI